MTGYQEILTDPSYGGQIVAMTYPEIGNVGVNREDVEARRAARARLHRASEYWDAPTQLARASRASATTCAQHGIVGIEGIDTRALVRHLRDARRAGGGASRRTDLDPERAGRAARKARPSLVGRTSCARSPAPSAYDWDEGALAARGPAIGDDAPRRRRPASSSPTTSASSATSCATSSSAGCRGARRAGRARRPPTCWRSKPDGVFLSNGPGDPDAVPYARESVARR